MVKLTLGLGLTVIHFQPEQLETDAGLPSTTALLWLEFSCDFVLFT